MKYFRFVSAVFLVCGLGMAQVFAQAAAESVLTHGLSSTAGSSLGKTLGSAMGNAASQLGGRVGQQTSTGPSLRRVPATRARTAPLPGVATTPGAAPSSGSLIASIQGGTTSAPAANCAAPPNPAQVDSSQHKPAPTAAAAPGTSAPPVPSPVAGPASHCRAVQGADEHPAVVNLPAAN